MPEGVKPTVCIDFDGCIAQYTGWTGKFEPPGEPVPGAEIACWDLSQRYRIVILTARVDLQEVKRWFEDHYFPAIEITNVKPPALWYIDDRAVRFNGDWTNLELPIQTWWEK